MNKINTKYIVIILILVLVISTFYICIFFNKIPIQYENFDFINIEDLKLSLKNIQSEKMIDAVYNSLNNYHLNFGETVHSMILEQRNSSLGLYNIVYSYSTIGRIFTDYLTETKVVSFKIENNNIIPYIDGKVKHGIRTNSEISISSNTLRSGDRIFIENLGNGYGNFLYPCGHETLCGVDVVLSHPNEKNHDENFKNRWVVLHPSKNIGEPIYYGEKIFIKADNNINDPTYQYYLSPCGGEAISLCGIDVTLRPLNGNNDVSLRLFSFEHISGMPDTTNIPIYFDETLYIKGTSSKKGYSNYMAPCIFKNTCGYDVTLKPISLGILENETIYLWKLNRWIDLNVVV